MPYQPDVGQVHLDAALTNFSLAYLEDVGDFIADQVFPCVPVPHKTDKYFVFPQDTFMRRGQFNYLQQVAIQYGVAFDPPLLDGGWHHVLCAFDLSLGSDGVVCYVDRVAKTGTPFLTGNRDWVNVFGVGTKWNAFTVPAGVQDGSGTVILGALVGDITEIWAMWGDGGSGIDFVGALPSALDFFSISGGSGVWATRVGGSGCTPGTNILGTGSQVVPQVYVGGLDLLQEQQQTGGSSSALATIEVINGITGSGAYYANLVSQGAAPQPAQTEPFMVYPDTVMDVSAGGAVAGPATAGAGVVGAVPVGSDGSGLFT